MEIKTFALIFLVCCILLTRNVNLIPTNNLLAREASIHKIVPRQVCTMSKTKCYGVVLACLNYRCEFNTRCNNFCCEKSCGSWYVCGACFGFPFR